MLKLPSLIAYRVITEFLKTAEQPVAFWNFGKGKYLFEDMDCFGRLRSAKETRVPNGGRIESKSGSISPESSPTSEDQSRSVYSKETLKRQYQCVLEQQGDVDDEFQIDDSSQSAEKKRRLTVEQVNFLEMSFEEDMRLEPERKALLAKRLGVVPRQVAIWFQNRRARWKNKHLEQEFELLKAKYSAVVIENESLQRENKAVVEENNRLMTEIARLIMSLHGLGNGGNMGFVHTTNGTQGDTTGRGIYQQAHGYQFNGKSALNMTTKLFDNQCTVHNSGQSYLATAGTAGASETGSDELGFAMLSPTWTVDDSDDLFGSMFNQFLSQKFAVGDQRSPDACSLYLGGEDQWEGFSCVSS